MRGENRREMGSKKERGKGGRYVKYLTLPCLAFLRTANNQPVLCLGLRPHLSSHFGGFD